MGSACCVAAKGRHSPERTGDESSHRDVVRSPSWSFRRDRRGRVAGETENPSSHPSSVVSRNMSIELKDTLSSERGNSSDRGSILVNSATPISQKSTVDEASVANLMTPSSDISVSSNFSTVVKNAAESSMPNLSTSIPPVFSSPRTDIYPDNNHLQHLTNSTPSRWAHRSPGHPLLRQISDSQISALKSPDNSISEGRLSFVLSACSSNELAAGSQYGSSDGWSMRTFSEMVASSQKEMWSLDGEYFGSGRRKISGSSSRFSYSPSASMGQQSCGACLRPVTERTTWCNQKFVASSDISCVAVLVCGHAYHAECLEAMTPEADKFDPACPICMVGDKQLSKLSRKVLRAESEMKAKNHKICRSRVADSYHDIEFNVSEPPKDSELGGKVSKMEASSSARNSFGKPFLKRHFSIGSKWNNRTLSENDSRKKGFWGRHKKN